MFKNRPSKICGRQPLKYLKGCGLPKADHTPSNFLKGCLPQILLGPFLNTLFLNSFNFLLAFLFVYLWVLFRFFFSWGCSSLDLVDTDELFLLYDYATKAVKPYIQLGPLSEILTITNLRHNAIRTWTCAETEFRFCWKKLCSSDTNMALKFDNFYRCLRVSRPSLALEGLEWKVITETYLALLISAGLMSVQGDP